MGVMYYNIIVIQMVRTVAERQGEQKKILVIKELTTGNKCHNI